MDQKPKILIFDQKVRDKILRGVEISARAVGATLGSRGRNVAYELNWGAPNVLHDGVSVAKQIVLEDPYENMAAQLVLQAATNTNNAAGDGTTTATILTYAITKEALQNVTAGANPMVLRKGIDKAVEAVIKELKRITKPVNTPEELKQIATISAADSEMGELIATAVQKVGKNGVVTVERGSTSMIEVEYKEGMEFEGGLLSGYFTTERNKLEANLIGDKKDDAPYVLVINEKVDAAKIINLVEKLYNTDQNPKLLIIADDYDNEAFSMILVNKIQGGKYVFPVKSPEFGPHRTDILSDIAVITGGQLLGGAAGLPLEQATIDSFGRAEKITIMEDQTIITGGKGKKDEIQGRITTIQKMLESAKTDSQKDKAQKRLGKLVGGVAVISVGAYSEAEMQERKERVFDAVNATKAAISEGIVPGGGVALLRAAKTIDTLDFTDQPNEKIGADIVKKALSYPIKKLVMNAGVERPEFVVGKIAENSNANFGYDVDTESYVDLYKKGIVDPLKVVRSALVNAASVAIMLITTEVMISFKRDEAKPREKSENGIGRFLD